MKGRRPSHSDATSFDMFQHVFDRFTQVCFQRFHNIFWFFLFNFCLWIFVNFFFLDIIQTAQIAFFLLWLHYIFSYVLGSVLRNYYWLIGGSVFLFFYASKVLFLIYLKGGSSSEKTSLCSALKRIILTEYLLKGARRFLLFINISHMDL